MIKNIAISSLLLIFSFLKLYSQDIEPRRWTPTPLGTHVIGVGYVYQFGDILFDPALQAEDVKLNMHAFAAVYVQPLKLGNKLGRLDVTLPYVTAQWEGLLSGVPTVKKRYGIADPRLRFSMNLIGPNAMNAQDMMVYYKDNPKNTMLGVSLAVTFPLGIYDEERLLNIGQNRFVFRPQIGVVHNWGLWSFEFSSSVFIFTNNNQFFNNQTKEQKPVFATQTHLIKRFSNRMWASVSVAYGLGGESVVENNELGDQHGDLLYSASFGTQLSKTQGVKLVYMRWETLRDVGSKTNSIGLSWTKLF